MIYFKHIALAACLVLAACSQKQEQTTDTATEATAYGRADAEKAIKAAPGSKERERAILHIRANEQKIRETGDTAAANEYARAAEERLDSAAII